MLRPLAVLLMLAASAPATHSAVAASRVDAVAAVIERAFQRGDADALSPVLPRRLKVLVASHGLGIAEGYYGADQLRVLLRRLFERRATDRFTFLESPPSEARGPITLGARWVYSENDAPPADIGLAFTLALDDDGDGPLREIRDLR